MPLPKPLLLQRAYLLLIAVLVFVGCWVAPIDAPARAQVNDGLKRALTTFAAARALGAVVSVAQGTQVDATPGGVGVSFAPGQALKPLNELIEQFAAQHEKAADRIGDIGLDQTPRETGAEHAEPLAPVRRQPLRAAGADIPAGNHDIRRILPQILLQRVAHARQQGFVMLKIAVDDGDQWCRCR